MLSRIPNGRPIARRDRRLHQSILDALLRELPARHRRALVCYYRDGLTIDQAAQLASMGIEAFRELKRSVRAQFFAATGGHHEQQ